MAVNLKIIGWTAKGLRCPDHDISFQNGSEVHRISLVQMPNGTGKTTTLRLLRAALTGPDIWTDSFDRVEQFRKDDQTEKGQFELRLLHNERRLTILLQLNFITGEFTYTTTGIQGKEPGFRPPVDLNPFLSEEFVKLLIFDGELASQLLDSKHTNAQKAIDEMYQLSFFPKIKERIDGYWQELAQNSGSSGGKKELSRRHNKVEMLKKRYESIKKLKKDTQVKRNKLQTTFRRLNTEFSKQIEKNKQDALDMKDAEANLESAEQRLSVKTRDLANLMKNPIDFSGKSAASISSLKESLDKAQLPGIAAREFFEEIAEEANCICGREIDSAIKELIKSGAKKYLGSEEVIVLNSMKTDIKNKLADSSGFPGKTLTIAIKELEDLQDMEIQARQNLDAIKLNAGVNNPEIDKIQRQSSGLAKTIGELDKELEKYEDKSDDSDESFNLDILARRIRRAEEELADSTGTIEQKKKKDILIAILDKAFQKSRSMLSEDICLQANRKIETLMPYNNIRIESINRSLRLAGKEGGSVGETLSVGYAFLSSLLSNTEHSLPSVVDSPSGPIDLEIRPEIGRLIPKLADQFIAFTISSERQNFVEPLLNEAPDIHFLTLFKRGKPQLEKAAKEIQGYKQTDDGMLVPGRAYFENFHTETEKD